MISQRFSRWNLVLITVLLVGVAFLIDPSGRSSSIFRFFGRLHPAMIHFPIVFVIVAFMGSVVNRFTKSERWDSVVHISLFLACWAGLKAVFAGSWLSQTGGYPSDLITLHKWFGIGIVWSSAFLLVVTTAGSGIFQTRMVRLVSWAAVLGGLVVGGDLGGQLTHGRGFVTQYAPAGLRLVLEHPDPMKTRFDLSTPDVTTVYDGIVSPILMEKCSSCHGADRGKGSLRLHTVEAITTHEGDEPLLTAGKPEESLLIKRIELPEGHEDQMPPMYNAKPISHADVELLKWWVSSGASFDQTIASVEMPTTIYTILQAYGLGGIRTGVFALDVAPPDTALIASWRQKGVSVDVLAEGESLLSVRCTVVQDCIWGPEADGLAANVTWIDLRNSDLTDESMAGLGRFPLLTRVNVAGTAISGSGLAAISGHEYLDYLNLYGSMVDDNALQHIELMKKLTSLYLWQTKVSEEGIARLRSALPQTEIDTGEAK